MRALVIRTVYVTVAEMVSQAFAGEDGDMAATLG